MRRCCLVALVLAAVAIVAPARGADMGLPPSYYPPAAALPPPLYNWTGFYIGGNIGAGLLKDDFSQAAAGPTFIVAPFTVSPVGVVGGLQVGADYQFSSVVVGVAVAGSGSSITGSANQFTTAAPPNQERMTSNPQWFGTATARIGYAANTLLIYAKGGGAFMAVQYTQDQLSGAAAGLTQSISNTRTGYTAGIGLEYAMTENLSALFEYDFMGFGSKTYNFAQTPMQISSDLNTLVVGLNYRFNWANGTVAERCPTC